eukprot:CAMPEP_0168389550 /NCGR_PEP_ID=MMETSP0228-20121227/17020_1 /TAXON_ID=133427 /ORGANISM="Protoceratium reticulatum, Strain CCCM 535 (=CCMP 1889)" /LENGTH=522 /DNA_ID=CAMNT_0008402823 /DNA_START=82 /DNA_END=1651 /DNA_ORIENTATION=-
MAKQPPKVAARRVLPKVKAMKAKRVQRQGAAPCKGAPKPDGFYSGRHQPQETKRGEAEIKEALKRGSVIMELGGRFVRVPLGQRLRFRTPCPEERSLKGPRERYEGYMGSATLRAAFQNGAMIDDIYYDAKKGFVQFVPRLHAKQARGPLPPSQWPPGVRTNDAPRPWWLPEDWAHGIKTTCRTKLRVYIAPNRRMYYHRPTIEGIVQQQLGGLDGMVARALEEMAARRTWAGQPVRFDPDSRLLACLPSPSELHICVISARRATELSGIRGIVGVQSRLLAAGAKPRWYVDEASLADYKRLGLDAVVGGRLTASRNMALEDAHQRRRACVQISDDITGWYYYNGSVRECSKYLDANEKLHEANKCAKNLITVSPVAAARFLLAKMRAAGGPRLGGVYPTGNAALGILSEAVSTESFILGDFFVHDLSPCRFDEHMTLKEDYDFTCAHIKEHGSVLRCNQLIVRAIHETNTGGAVAVRDAKGEKELQNIRILMRKWPGVFRPHGTRGETQVTMGGAAGNARK